MSFYKEVPCRKTTLESTLKFDTTPTAGSTNPVTSDGIASAITEAVGGASDELQEQIDDIAEKAGSGYTPKGEASVATLNGLSGQENGWLYTMTDAGTLTDGSLAVVAGDTVAWDATNEVWYKAMDYATKEEFNDFVFKRNGYNPVNIELTRGSYLSKSDGSLVEYNSMSMYSDYFEIVDGNAYVITAKAINATCMYAVYDASKNFIASYGKTSGVSLEWDKNVVLAKDILSAHSSAKYVRFGSYKITSSVVKLDSVFKNCDEGYESSSDKIDGKVDNSKYNSFIYHDNGAIVDLELTQTADYYINKGNGNLNTIAGASCTDYVQIPSYDFAVNANAAYQTCIYAVYDSSKTFLASYGKTAVNGEYVKYKRERISVSTILTNHPSAKYIRFSSFNVPLVVCKFDEYDCDSAFDKLLSSSSLAGKKWVSCGDSFTHGGNLGSSGYDNVFEMYRSYPWWIARRNNMNLVNIARSGERITNGGSVHFTPDRYKTIPTDADIVTLAFGLNETSVEIGDSTSSDNTTLWGAFNEVIGWILTNIPKCKIGIIINDAWMTSTIADAEKAIGAYYGIPVLDLKFDNNVPLGIGGRPDVSSDAVNARNGVFQDGTGHPNEDAHKYRSTYIEAWMKSL